MLTLLVQEATCSCRKVLECSLISVILQQFLVEVRSGVGDKEGDDITTTANED